jgi:hypothetical protein
MASVAPVTARAVVLAMNARESVVAHLAIVALLSGPDVFDAFLAVTERALLAPANSVVGALLAASDGRRFA